MLILRATVLVAALSTALLLAVWGGQDRAWALQGEKEGTSGESSSVTLEIEGEKGAPFSGFCKVGDERRDLSGEAPKSYEYDLGDGELACEIRKEDAQGGGLEVVLSGENTRSAQRIEGGEGVVRMTYDGNEVASSVSSSSSSAKDDVQSKDAEELADEIQQMVDDILDRFGQ